MKSYLVVFLLVLFCFSAKPQSALDSLDLDLTKAENDSIFMQTIASDTSTVRRPIADSVRRPSYHYASWEVGVGHGLEEFGSLVPYVMFQTHVDWVFTPFPEDHIVGLGAQIGLTLLASKDHDVPGGVIETRSNLIDICLLGRLHIPIKSKVRPFFDAVYGVGISYTHSNLKIIDRANLFESFLGQEDREINETVGEFSNSQALYGIGGGIEVNKRWFVHFRMYYGGVMEFVNKDGISLNDHGNIVYAENPARVKFYTFGLGVNFHNILRQ